MSEIIPSTATERLWKLLTDRDYRRGFNRSQIGGGLAAQIFRLRKKSSLTQRRLADEIGSSQSQVSAWETSCDNATLASLYKLADAFDVGLIVKFAPFSEIAREAVFGETLNTAVPSFDADCHQAASYRVKTGMIAVSGAQISPQRVSNGHRRAFGFVSSINPIDDSAIQRRSSSYAS